MTHVEPYAITVEDCAGFPRPNQATFFTTSFDLPALVQGGPT